MMTEKSRWIFFFSYWWGFVKAMIWTNENWLKNNQIVRGVQISVYLHQILNSDIDD